MTRGAGAASDVARRRGRRHVGRRDGGRRSLARATPDERQWNQGGDRGSGHRVPLEVSGVILSHILMDVKPRTLTLVAAALLLAPVAHGQSKKPNILILWGDDIGYWNLSAYNQGMMGYRTPNIDRIAKEGV